MGENEFGDLLEIMRLAARVPETGKPLSQEQLALRADEILGGKGQITRNVLSDLKIGQRSIRNKDWDMLLAIIEVLHTCKGLTSLEDANRLLAAANLRNLSPEEAGRINPGWLGPPRSASFIPSETNPPVEEGQPSLVWPPTLPNEPYFQLPLRDRDLDQLVEQMRDAATHPVAVIDGLGGLGKTALGVELARRLATQKDYAALLGESAKMEILTGHAIVGVREAVLSFESLLDSLARQLSRWDLTTAPLEEKIVRLAYIFSEAPHLLIIDNLESSENADEIAVRLNAMLGVSQAIITSRNKVRIPAAIGMSLDGLEQEDSLQYLEEEARAAQAPAIMDATKDQLIRIARMTGGAILAMKLIVAQAKHIDLEILLKPDQAASGNLYRFIYYRSWQQLSESAQKILIHIGRAGNAPVGRLELAKLGAVEDDAGLNAALDQLTDYSLLSVHPGTRGFRYAIHQLTRQFVNSDLPAIWREQGWRPE